MGNFNSRVRHMRGALSCVGGGASEGDEDGAARGLGESGRVARSDAAGGGAGSEGATGRDQRSLVDERIESSMVHWSELATSAPMTAEEEEAVRASNLELFRTLQRDPQWSNFFWGLEDFAVLEVGEKFAEGAQAELFHASVTWKDAEDNEQQDREGIECAVKVFKKGTLLHQLQSQWPQGMLLWHAEELQRRKLGKPPPIQVTCDVQCGILLEDGRFAFLMQKEQEDLRSVIDKKMLSTREGQGPFLSDLAKRIMYTVAEGMDWLHDCDIIHRDLKASNVLWNEDESGFACYVADFECSVGVVGTGFWRAPEILQALKDKSIRLELFTKEADVYSYAMTCYEILTGELPFQGHSVIDYDLVLKQRQRPRLPKYVDDWVCELLNRCWEEDPQARPSFKEIVDILSTNSVAVRKDQVGMQEWQEEYEKKWEEERLKKSLLIEDVVMES